MGLDLSSLAEAAPEYYDVPVWPWDDHAGVRSFRMNRPNWAVSRLTQYPAVYIDQAGIRCGFPTHVPYRSLRANVAHDSVWIFEP